MKRKLEIIASVWHNVLQNNPTILYPSRSSYWINKTYKLCQA